METVNGETFSGKTHYCFQSPTLIQDEISQQLLEEVKRLDDQIPLLQPQVQPTACLVLVS